ncbi:MAG: hypothetical protein ACP5OE_08440 [Thermodesulfobium sp.]
MVSKTLWILTEEKPKVEILRYIIYRFCTDNHIPCFIDTLRILPILDKNRKFSFLYELIGFKCNIIAKVLIRIVSGYSSFVDYLIFYQEEEPDINNKPLYAIEETKTDDSESRNTGVYQRASKFIYLEHYYPETKKIMYYDLKIQQKKEPTHTYIFGTRCLMTLGVEIVGKKLDQGIFKPFTNVDELIQFKKAMRPAHRGNVQININKYNDRIEISGRLIKSGTLSHDPNIGALSLISATLRKLGWKRDIVIINHGLNQTHINSENKFIKIAKILNLTIDGLKLPESQKDDPYWKYEKEGEKLGTIFIHIVVENFANGMSIFENHAGSEKGYFITAKGEPIPLKKYSNRELYKSGDKSKIVAIPDLILIDFGRCEIINIEGKKYEFRAKAIEDLKAYDDIERMYIKLYYPRHKIIRTVVLYGSHEKRVAEIQVGFLLNEDGDMVLGLKPPELFKDAIKNLIDFWFSE